MESDLKKKPTTISEIFHDAFPHYLVMGMSPEEYWDGDSWLVRGYRKAYSIRIENENRIADRNAWRMGEYIRHAITSVPIVVNGFVPKGHHMHDYPELPMLQQAEEQKKAETQKKQQENQQMLAQAMFQAFTEKINKGIRKRLESEKATVT